MAQFLPVVPPNYMNKIHSVCNKGTIGAFLLAHEVVKNPGAYSGVRHLWQNDGSGPEVISILDNSAIELGVAVDLDMVKAASDICHPQVVVLPDALEDADNTIRLTKEAYPIWDRVFANQSLMFVPQGKDFRDWVRCLETVMESFDTQPDWIGIPRNTTGRICPSRSRLVDIVATLYPANKIHLLGFSDYVWDDLVTAQHPCVTSIDSAAPFRMPQFMAFEHTPKRGNWWDDVKNQTQDEIPDYVVTNALRLSQIVNNDLE